MPECTFINLLLAKIQQGNFTIPTMPDIAVQMMAITEDSSSKSSDLVNTIQKDGGISMRLIRLANSVHFKRRQEVTNVHQAVVRIGYQQVKSLVVAMAMEQLFISNDSFIREKLRNVWADSVKITSHSIALNHVQDKGRDFNTLMLLGTTCRIGMLALLCELERRYNRSVYQEIDMNNLSVVERDVIINVVRKWEFPATLRNVIEDFFRGQKHGISRYLHWANTYEPIKLEQLPEEQQAIYLAKQLEIQTILS